MKRLTAIAAFCAILGLLSSAHANPEVDTMLAAAEAAYQAVDFPTTHEQAANALAVGGATRAQTARLEVLQGLAAAALGNADEAKQSFLVALAVDPDLKLDKSLAPKIRGPYLDARGYWGAHSDRLALRAKLSSDLRHIGVELRDPASLVANVECYFRAPGSAEVLRVSVQAAPLVRFSPPARVREGGFEYWLRGVDAHGNALTELGTEADPRAVTPEAVSPNRDVNAVPARGGRSLALPIVLSVAGLGATAAGVIFHVQREQAAHEWNGPSCEHPGATRVAQCSEVDTRRARDEHLAIGFYAGGAALLTSSVILLATGRAPEAERAQSLGCAIAGTAVACRGTF